LVAASQVLHDNVLVHVLQVYWQLKQNLSEPLSKYSKVGHTQVVERVLKVPESQVRQVPALEHVAQL